MKVLSKLSLLLFGWVSLAGTGGFQKALDQAVAEVANKPIQYELNMWTSNLEGEVTTRMAGEVQLESTSRFKVSFSMEGPFHGKLQKSEGLFLSDGKFGWRGFLENGELQRLVKTHADGLIDWRKDSFSIFIDLEKFLEAIQKLQGGQVSSEAMTLTKDAKINAAFQNHIALFENEGDMVGDPIQVTLTKGRGFPLTLKFHVEEKLFAHIKFSEVTGIDQAQMDRVLAFTPPEDVKVMDRTKEN